MKGGLTGFKASFVPRMSVESGCEAAAVSTRAEPMASLRIGESVPEAIACDLKLEQHARPLLQEAIAHCEKVGDYISRELFEDILESEEEHIDWLETQLDLIDKVGLQNYLQSQMS